MPQHVALAVPVLHGAILNEVEAQRADAVLVILVVVAQARRDLLGALVRVARVGLAERRLAAEVDAGHREALRRHVAVLEHGVEHRGGIDAEHQHAAVEVAVAVARRGGVGNVKVGAPIVAQEVLVDVGRVQVAQVRGGVRQDERAAVVATHPALAVPHATGSTKANAIVALHVPAIVLELQRGAHLVPTHELGTCHLRHCEQEHVGTAAAGLVLRGVANFEAPVVDLRLLVQQLDRVLVLVEQQEISGKLERQHNFPLGADVDASALIT
mmetsp:Transcript_56787/g.139650  ORF Transcript_56787/g.139650 Transcript_56787/m.139650 type:complete len:270 (+) Transcript_56787:862-1671(+)